nr:MAG TPA: hypothetical protein [Caudoviricetes sp.]
MGQPCHSSVRNSGREPEIASPVIRRRNPMKRPAVRPPLSNGCCRIMRRRISLLCNYTT